MYKKLSIVIPAYNEGRTIHLILDKVKAVQMEGGMEKEVIVVNDCSKDDTVEAVERYKKENPELNIAFHSHPVNMGKGAALHTGIKEATGDIVIIQDADLEYNPQEFNILVRPITDGFADVVYGSRFMGGRPHRILFFWHTIGNKFLTTLSNMFTNLNLSDMETCYKVFKREVLDSFVIEEDRFGFEPEITAKLAKQKLRIYEMGVSYSGRTYDEGKKIGWKDGLSAIRCIVKYNLFR